MSSTRSYVGETNSGNTTFVPQQKTLPEVGGTNNNPNQNRVSILIIVLILVLALLGVLAWKQGWFKSKAEKDAQAYFQHHFHGKPLPRDWTETETEEALDRFREQYLFPAGWAPDGGINEICISTFYFCRDNDRARLFRNLTILKHALPAYAFCEMLNYMIEGGCLNAAEAEALARSLGVDCSEAAPPGGSAPPRPNIPGLGQ